jgi:hypothetical protein
MLRTFATTALLLLAAACASADVINVEFKFTPFVGDPATQDQVQTVPGTARVFLNSVPYAEQEIESSEVPVLFDEREIAASVWLPVESAGPALRKGKNTFRVEFTPRDDKARYRAQLRWASVMDETVESSDGGNYAATNQTGAGVDDKEARGPITFEREFVADFAADLPWHHNPAVTSLTAEDRSAILRLVAARVEAFQPDFAPLYALLDASGKIDGAAVREARCLEAAHAAGLRVAARPESEIEILPSGGPEVVVSHASGQIYYPVDPSRFEKIEDEDIQMAVGMALFVVYPPRLVFVRSAAGAWDAAY